MGVIKFSMRMDGLMIYRYTDMSGMLDDIAEMPCYTEYLNAALVDYSKFIESYCVPISLDTFISQYWNIVPYFAVKDLTAGRVIYNYGFGKINGVTVVEPMHRDEDQDYDVIIVEDINKNEWHTFPGLLYYEPSCYKKVTEKPMERMVNKQWQMKAYLITKTSQPLS